MRLVQHVSVVELRRGVRVARGRVTEYVDHLHEHFVDPCVVKGGNYLLPSRPGYSAQMRGSSVAAHSYPGGAVWSGGDAS